MFGVRALVTGAFQAAYVYTPEVRINYKFFESISYVNAISGLSGI